MCSFAHSSASRRLSYGNAPCTFLGRSLLLGLEFLVAGDIIKTVAIEPTRDSVVVLAVIVLVRTVLSLSIDVEIDGRWPWQAAEQEALARAAQARDVASPETGTRTRWCAAIAEGDLELQQAERLVGLRPRYGRSPCHPVPSLAPQRRILHSHHATTTRPSLGSVRVQPSICRSCCVEWERAGV